MEIKVLESVFSANDDLAEKNTRFFKEKGIFAINLMASPGSGKTSLILETAQRLKKSFVPAVIEGDIASNVDTDKVRARGIKSVQINTGGACHLEANMVKQALDHLDLENVNLLIIENVGNLVCPADFSLGEAARVVILSVPEGDDKPLKYPSIFAGASVVIVNKIDMIPLSDFDLELFREIVFKLNPDMKIIPLSCRTGEGFEAWEEWLAKNVGHTL